MDETTCRKLVEEARKRGWEWLPTMVDGDTEKAIAAFLAAMREGWFEGLELIEADLHFGKGWLTDRARLDVVLDHFAHPSVVEALQQTSLDGVAGWSVPLARYCRRLVYGTESDAESEGGPFSVLRAALLDHDARLPEPAADLLHLISWRDDLGRNNRYLPRPSALRRLARLVLQTRHRLISTDDDVHFTPPYDEAICRRSGGENVCVCAGTSLLIDVARYLSQQRFARAVGEVLLEGPTTDSFFWWHIAWFQPHLSPEQLLAGWQWAHQPRADVLLSLALRKGPKLLPHLDGALRTLDERLQQPARGQEEAALHLASRSLEWVDAWLRAKHGERVPERVLERLTDLLRHEEPGDEQAIPLELLRAALRGLPPERRANLLLGALGEATPSSAAAYLAGTAPQPEVLDALWAALARREVEQPGRLAWSLAAFGDALPARLEGAADLLAHPANARALVQALAALATPEAADALVSLLAARHKPVRAAATVALVSLGTMGREAIARGAEGGSAAVRRACRGLLDASASWTDEPLRPRLQARLDGKSREDIEATLDELALRAAADLPNRRPRRALLDRVKQLGAPALLPVYDWFLEEPKDRLRSALWTDALDAVDASDADAARMAVYSLAWLPKVEASVRKWFDASIGRFGALAAQAAIDVLAVASPAERQVLLGVVAKHAPEEGQEVLLAGLEDGSAAVRRICAKALSELGAAVVPRLLERLRARKKGARLAAAEALGRIAAPEHLEALRAALGETEDAELLEHLELAVARAERPAGAPPPVDELLAQQEPASLPRWLDLEALPPLRSKGGLPLSERAVRGLLALLVKERPANDLLRLFHHVNVALGKLPSDVPIQLTHLFHGANVALGTLPPDLPASEIPGLLLRQMRPLLCDEDAHAFGAAVFHQWLEAGRPAKDNWALLQLAVLGEEQVLEPLAPRLDELAGQGEHHFARWVVETMARHGSHRMLSWVAHWSRAARRESLREEARRCLILRAEALDEDPRDFIRRFDPFVAEEVADQQTPTFGLEGGARSFDLGGGRRVELRLAPGGQPLYWDPQRSTPIKKVPAAADQAEAREARAILLTTRKELRSTIAALTKRLELAMIEGRRWSASRFRALFLEHPLFVALGEAFVFRTDEGLTFRPAEGVLRAVDFEDVALPPETRVRLLHRIEMSEREAVAWREHLAEADLEQPFEQVERPVFDPSGHPFREPFGSVPTATLAARIRSLGWTPGPVEGATIVYTAFRSFPASGVRVELRHGGYSITDPSWQGEVPVGVERVRFLDPFDLPLDVDQLPPVVFSEVRYDLERLLA